MGTVTVGSNDYEVYGDIDGAEYYLGGSMSPAAVSWRALSDDNKARTLVEATRYLDRLYWQGEKTDDAQALEWPRTDVVIVVNDSEVDVDPDTVPTAIVSATYELAAAVNKKPGLLSSTGPSLVSSASTGSASVSFFAPAEGGRLPATVEDLIGRYLGGAAPSGTSGAIATGTCEDSAFDDEDDFNLGS